MKEPTSYEPPGIFQEIFLCMPINEKTPSTL